MTSDPQPEEAAEREANSREHLSAPLLFDILSTPTVYSSSAERQLQAWEYEQLGTEMEQFMEQMEPTPFKSTVAPSWPALMQQPIEVDMCYSDSTCNPNSYTSGPQSIISGTFDPLPQDNSGLELFDEVSLPLSPELLLAYSSMLVDPGSSTMSGLELQPADLTSWNAMNFAHTGVLQGFAIERLGPHTQPLAQGIGAQQLPTNFYNDYALKDAQVFMPPEEFQTAKDLSDGEMSPWERVEQESSDSSEWEQVSVGEHSDRSDWEHVSIGNSDRSDWEHSGTDLESTTSTSTSEQEEASAALTTLKAKRGRTTISHQRKLEIIDFCSANKHLTSEQQSKALGVVRTTMVNILSQQKMISMRPTTINPLTLQKEILKPATTVTSSRLHIMDLLLCEWIKELRGQHIPVPDEKVRWQAFAVHRMLSGLTNEPLPPCSFSGGWMKNFKVRMGLKMKKVDPLLFANNSAEVKELQTSLGQYQPEDIYTCDVTSIFALPGCVLRHPKKACTLLSISKNKKKKGSDCVMGPGVSLLLLCNGTGSKRQEPVMLDRLQQYAPGNFGSQVNTAKDVRRIAFRDWLAAFDQEVQRESLLLISEDTCEQIRRDLSGLRRIKVAVVPKHLNAWLPMRTGIAREFKSHINAINFERTLNPGRFSEGDTYSMAMHDIESSVIIECFEWFSAAVNWSRKGKPRDAKLPSKPKKRGKPRYGISPSESTKERKTNDAKSAVALTGGQERLKSVFLSAHKNAETKENVLLYYLNQDCDIGPSAFLCNMIERMHLRSDVEPYLNPSGLGIRKESWWSHVVITSQTP
ncbi:hypothetical protein EC968_004483 [Mortierella alpina]|nr:hypothetical protein EC968_004483 [Mortierella alpina]